MRRGYSPGILVAFSLLILLIGIVYASTTTFDNLTVLRNLYVKYDGCELGDDCDSVIHASNFTEASPGQGLSFDNFAILDPPNKQWGVRFGTNVLINGWINATQYLNLPPSSTGNPFNQSLNTSDSVNFKQVNTVNVTINNTGIYWVQGSTCKNRMFFNGTHFVFNGNC